jgi:hypothetical protein
LQYVTSELKEIANDSPEAETPVFLLAFVTYNSHHEDQTAGWLASAEKRAGASDPTLTDLKRYWNLKTAPATQPSVR